MKAVITVTGHDNIGIIAVSAPSAPNTEPISSTSRKASCADYFAMIMLADIDALTIPFSDFVDTLATLGRSNGLDIHTMHEEIFNSMHRI